MVVNVVVVVLRIMVIMMHMMAMIELVVVMVTQTVLDLLMMLLVVVLKAKMLFMMVILTPEGVKLGTVVHVMVVWVHVLNHSLVVMDLVRMVTVIVTIFVIIFDHHVVMLILSSMLKEIFALRRSSGRCPSLRSGLLLRHLLVPLQLLFDLTYTE